MRIGTRGRRSGRDLSSQGGGREQLAQGAGRSSPRSTRRARPGRTSRRISIRTPPGRTTCRRAFPPWAHADGKLLERLRDPATRAAHQDGDDRASRVGWESLCLAATPQGVEVVGFKVDSLKKYEGKRLPEIGARVGQGLGRRADRSDAAREERLGAGDLRRVGFERRDAGPPAVDEVRHRRRGVRSGDSARSRRTRGRTARIRASSAATCASEHVLTLEDAVRKMTWAVAERLSIRDRGSLREGMFADIMIFDPNTIIDRATYEAPHQLSVGMRWVFVNGVAVVADGQVTGEKPGRLVRGPGWSGNRQ